MRKRNSTHRQRLSRQTLMANGRTARKPTPGLHPFQQGYQYPKSARTRCRFRRWPDFSSIYSRLTQRESQLEAT
jgi:hypothetical protein